MDYGFSIVKAIGSWGRSTQSCSATSQALLYSIIVSSILISAVGVYVWLRFIRTQPMKASVPMISAFVGTSSFLVPCAKGSK
jgi:uncharacterized membrane protein YidH (DUF202 family)